MVAVPIVTALRARRPGRVEVELDGAPWRVVPAEAVHRAGLAVGGRLDRPRARELGRELRRQQALGTALGALRWRDHTAASLEQRLVQRGVAPPARRQALETLDRAGLVDDVRFAQGRAALLAGRGSGNLLIADDLERHGVAKELVADALGSLAPERDRVSDIVERRGLSVRTLRALTAKGFSEAAIEPLVAHLEDGAVGYESFI